MSLYPICPYPFCSIELLLITRPRLSILYWFAPRLFTPMKFPALIPDTFASKVVQSATESAPVLDTDARARESACHESERPFIDPRVTAS
jgi:hypothetical protein